MKKEYNLLKTMKSGMMGMKMTSGKINLKIILIGIVFLITYGITFLHFSYPKLKSWQPYKEYTKNYKKIISNSNKRRNILIKELETKGYIEYANKFNEIENDKKAQLKVFYKREKELKKEYSYFGYSSFRYFLYALGLPFFAFVLSIFLTVIILNPKTIKVFKQLYLIACFGFLYVSTFWVLRSFLTRTDFPEWSYNLSYILAALVTTVLIFTALKLLTAIEQKKKQTQKELEEIVLNGKELVELLTPKMP